ncbi:MAG: hypothetical protein A2487_08620 [Candidatus Raymondbacteria bacterium RifOxyC12_full_50_8]|nr:MAG: hypothetical protein A2350_08525 [Candidatus Raymondbacteria bacterium RifOxyB12_full_50_8]OGK05549.1 MAG: hypothetical protein A2487_08620 [Candidatus Raymondbacteria bacterium RifOxyC12_full_50_8]
MTSIYSNEGLTQKTAEKADVRHLGRLSLARTFSLTVVLAGLAVIAGWIFQIGVLTSISPSWVSMKFTTAIAFVLSGITLYLLTKARTGEFDLVQVALSMISFTLALLMGLFIFSAFLRVHTGLEDLFVIDPGSPTCVVPGRPSMLTMLNFILIAVAGMLAVFNTVKLSRKLRAIGIIVGSIGLIAIIGYISGTPVLFYYIAGFNTAMALHTAALFVLLGIGLACI